MNLKPGALIKGRYEIMAELGEGGFAKVFRARDVDLDRIVALKILKVSAGDTAIELDRFQREAKLLGQLHHPNIVSVYSIDLLDDSSPIIVMEFLSGRSLQQVLLEREKLDYKTCQEIFSQTCSGLAYAHRIGIVHRDLSPANIFLIDGQDLNVKIIDFGLARLFGDLESSGGLTLTQTGALVGNPSYMSPEQSRGERLDERSDIYSLGCMFYQAMAGKTPFEAWNPIGLLHKHQNEYPEPPQTIWKDKAAELYCQNIVLKCMQKSKEKRFQNAEEILNALKEINAYSAFSNIDAWTLPADKKRQFAASNWVLGAVSTLGVIAFLCLFGRDCSVALLKNCQLDGVQNLKEYLALTISPNSPRQAAELLSGMMGNKSVKADKQWYQRVCLELGESLKRAGEPGRRVELVAKAIDAGACTEEFLKKAETLLDNGNASQNPTDAELLLRSKMLEQALACGAKRSFVRLLFDTLVNRSALLINQRNRWKDEQEATINKVTEAANSALKKQPFRTDESEEESISRIVANTGVNKVLAENRAELCRLTLKATNSPGFSSQIRVERLENMMIYDRKRAYEFGIESLRNTHDLKPTDRILTLLKMTEMAEDFGLRADGVKHLREAEYILNNDISSSPFDHLYWGVRIYTANWALSGNTEAEKRCAVEKLYSLLPETDELLIPASLFVFDNHSKRVMSGGVRMADNRCHQIFQNAAMVFIRLGKIDYADAFLKKYLYLLREANVSAKYGNDFAKLKREPNALPSTKKIIDEILASEKSDWQTQ